MVPERAAAFISCASSIPPEPEVPFITLTDRIFEWRTQARTERARAVRHETQHSTCAAVSVKTSGLHASNSFPLLLGAMLALWFRCGPRLCVTRSSGSARVSFFCVLFDGTCRGGTASLGPLRGRWRCGTTCSLSPLSGLFLRVFLRLSHRLCLYV